MPDFLQLSYIFRFEGYILPTFSIQNLQPPRFFQQAKTFNVFNVFSIIASLVIYQIYIYLIRLFPFSFQSYCQ